MNLDYKYFLELIQQDLLPSEQECVVPEFARFINKVKADAWDEALDSCNDYSAAAPNPYRNKEDG